MLRGIIVVFFIIGASVTSFSQEANCLKILSWNIHMLPGNIYQATKKIKRARLIAEQLCKREDDVIVFQEAFHFRARRVLKKRLKEKFPYIYQPLNFQFLSAKTNAGVWVLSKIKLTQIQTVKFDSSSGSSRWARKGAVLFEGDLDGNIFQLIGTHTNGGYVNNSQFRQIANELIIPYQKNKVPQIICGDLNCSMSNLKDYNSMLTILNAKDESTTGGYNYSNYEKTAVIDYILLKDNNSTIDQDYKRILLIGSDWQVGKRKYPKTVGLSDHMPIEIAYSFKSN
ncbi:MAG: hypothetical protein CMD01_00530 [Flavobacteriales bacterium]|nr:hypothetical protein [Flavobacteriales bacterium]